jgi:hypothetical protein
MIKIKQLLEKGYGVDKIKPKWIMDSLSTIFDINSNEDYEKWIEYSDMFKRYEMGIRYMFPLLTK